MLTYYTVDPVAFRVGPLAVHWYGLAYLLGFTVVWRCVAHQLRHQAAELTVAEWDDCIFISMLLGIVGGRVGYMLIYNWPVLITQPLTLLKVWQGGMSFHGGILGASLGLWWFAQRQKIRPSAILDRAVVWVPIAIGLGRLANFINGELWGRVASADLPWAMVFPHVDSLPRHPSQLYEVLLEGVVLFLILQCFSRYKLAKLPGAMTGAFLSGYGVLRCLVELWRMPDAQLGFVMGGWVTMGQLLSVPLIVVGMCLLWRPYKNKGIVHSFAKKMSATYE